GGRRAVGRLDASRTGKGENRRGGAAARGPDQGEPDATSSRAGPGIVSLPRRRGVRVLGKPRLVGKRWQDNVEGGAALRVVFRPEPALVARPQSSDSPIAPAQPRQPAPPASPKLTVRV